MLSPRARQLIEDRKDFWKQFRSKTEKLQDAQDEEHERHGPQGAHPDDCPRCRDEKDPVEDKLHRVGK